tara:strand:+ start:620 stop:982 length:363 start_codon:yes stop_codon:yes gene_type:complete
MVSSFQLANHVVGVMIDQDITDEYLEEIHTILLDKIKEFGRINFYCEILNGHDIPFKLLMEELKFKYDNSDSIHRVAVVTDLTWLKSVMNITGFVLSSDIKTYDLNERLEAISWVSENIN